MANCGCKPCKKPIVTDPKACKPFSICVGNHSLIWDGKCATIQERTFQIPDGTYTSLTFEGGCIVGVGQAPIPEYTPQACCGEETPLPTNSGNSLNKAKGFRNLVSIQNGSITVEPEWYDGGNIKVSGYGTADNPWKPSIRISSKKGNTIEDRDDGIFARLFFKSTDNVTVEGDGTELKPYMLKVVGADAKLAEINKEEIEGNGFTIDKNGRIKADSDLKLVTNLRFDNDAYTVMDAGSETVVVVDTFKLNNGISLKVAKGLKGTGKTGDELQLDLTPDLVNEMLNVISQDNNLKQRLKTILGV